MLFWIAMFVLLVLMLAECAAELRTEGGEQRRLRSHAPRADLGRGGSPHGSTA